MELFRPSLFRPSLFRKWPLAMRTDVASDRLMCVAIGAAVVVMAVGVIASKPHAALVLVGLAPVLEELLFRAGLQESLLRRGLRPLAANLGATLAFALLHGMSRSWPLALAVVLPSLLLGRLYQSNRRLLPVVGLHAVMNLLWVALGTRVVDLLPFAL